MLSPEIKTRWVAALRSGEYKRGRFKLRELGDLYDATGVLCELAVADGVIPPARKREAPEATHFFGYLYGDPALKNSHATGLPKAVVEWSGLDYRIGYKIAMMGDEGKSFDTLADYIEETL